MQGFDALVNESLTSSLQEVGLVRLVCEYSNHFVVVNKRTCTRIVQGAQLLFEPMIVCDVLQHEDVWFHSGKHDLWIDILTGSEWMYMLRANREWRSEVHPKHSAIIIENTDCIPLRMVHPQWVQSITIMVARNSQGTANCLTSLWNVLGSNQATTNH